ncbi:uncharacterized protein LY79DRAFT_672380 [Colletotrichum navitas]|uniref:Uncharacterized protein n=1 Tax=Colletotrichum navitas TaxID=681940 RepID=A0AAD8PRU7_9PEZI|nr:uncharacterized protein LY79DRAFT_672380 [Colletotrichum navitas]KAK1579589.1 hypothetical protein LY79DRAFT_672380 [Colletotrichum navitas]
MKTSIINAIIVGFVAGIKVAEACGGNYDNCRCTMADGSIANEITGAACRAYNAGAKLDAGATAYTVWAQNNEVTYCQGGTTGTGEGYVPVDSCAMLSYCVGAGATGTDASCMSPQ